jgi:hypothetical protein
VRAGALPGFVTPVLRPPTLDTILGLAYAAPDQAEPGSDI